MTNLIKFVFFCIFLSLISYAESDQLQRLRLHLETIEDHGIENYEPLTEEIREELSQYYCEILTDKHSMPPKRWPQILLMLNRPCGIEMVLQKYYDRIDQEGSSLYDNQFALASHASESVLPYMYENVYHGADIFGIRRDANLLVLHIIMNSHRFPEESRQWAKGMRDRMILGPIGPYIDSILLQIKDWLYYNKAEILNERYERATWLPAGPPSARVEEKIPPPPPEPPPPVPPFIERPILTKLVKAASPGTEVRMSKARLIYDGDFFPTRSRELKRPDHQPSKVEDVELGRGSWGVWLVGILLVVLVTLSWNPLRKRRIWPS